LSKPVTREALKAALDRWLPAAPKAASPPLSSAPVAPPSPPPMSAPATARVPANGPADPAEDSGVDEVLLGELRELAVGEGPTFLADLFESFPNEARLRVQGLQDAAARGDRRALLQLAHALKGSSANRGASRLAKLCGVLEVETRQALEKPA